MDQHGGDGPPAQQWAVAAQASSALVGPVVLGVLLDWQLGWTPVGTLSGIGVGLVLLMTLLIRMVKRSGE
jgi:hypothetical protein